MHKALLIISVVAALLFQVSSPAHGSHDPKAVHEGEALAVRAACEEVESMNAFALMLNDESTIEDVRIFLWRACPMFSTIQSAIITEVLQILDAHQRRWFIVKFFILERGREYYSFWSTSLDQRDA